MAKAKPGAANFSIEAAATPPTSKQHHTWRQLGYVILD